MLSEFMQSRGGEVSAVGSTEKIRGHTRLLGYKSEVNHDPEEGWHRTQ